MEEESKIKEGSLVIGTLSGLPGLVRNIDNEISSVFVTFFTEGKSADVYIKSIRLITPNERQQLAYIKGTKIMTLKQDHLIDYIKKYKGKE